MPGSLEGDLFVCLFGEEIIQEKGGGGWGRRPSPPIGASINTQLFFWSSLFIGGSLSVSHSASLSSLSSAPMLSRPCSGLPDSPSCFTSALPTITPSAPHDLISLACSDPLTPKPTATDLSVELCSASKDIYGLIDRERCASETVEWVGRANPSSFAGRFDAPGGRRAAPARCPRRSLSFRSPRPEKRGRRSPGWRWRWCPSSPSAWSASPASRAPGRGPRTPPFWGDSARTHTHTERERERERENEEQMCSQFSGYVPFEKFVTIRVACRT